MVEQGYRLAERRLEAAPGIEPGIAVLQTTALPLGYAAIHNYKTILSKIQLNL
ncbi:MAG: hypothetical protein SZ59_C0002G0379 [candidate division TM6 bacterium GW2011_GWF2_28_16]|nr:MAG: hypothetical protein SZ59_C0002G0379 [candidate division TM6 bacterium GW2011_GWF2_28_16]